MQSFGSQPLKIAVQKQPGVHHIVLGGRLCWRNLPRRAINCNNFFNESKRKIAMATNEKVIWVTQSKCTVNSKE